MNWIQECKTRADSLTPDQRQAILDAILDAIRTGQKLGAVASAHGVDLATVCGVVDRNIITTSLMSLSTESS